MKGNFSEATNTIHVQPPASRLRQMNWNSSDDDQISQDDNPLQQFQQSTPRFNNTKKDLSKEFMKMHQRLQENKKKRQQTANLAVPSNRETLLLKYGPAPPQKNPRPGLVQKPNDGEVPSYKKDAMRLIINRIYRYIGNVFHEMQKKVVRDDIMRQRKELYELMKEQQQLNKNAGEIKVTKAQIQQSLHNESKSEAGSFINADNVTNQIPEGAQLPEKANLRQMYELKMKRIKDNCDKLFYQQEISSIDHHENQTSQKDYSLYETPGKDEILQIDNYIQDDSVNNNNNTLNENQVQQEVKIPQFRDNNFESLRKQSSKITVNNRYNSDQDEDEDGIEEEEHKINDESQVDDDQIINLEKVQNSEKKVNNSPIMEADQSNEYSNVNESLASESKFNQQIEDTIKPSIKKSVASYLVSKENLELKPKSQGLTIKSSKPQLKVEMSFSENPFDRRQSGYMNQSSSLGRDSPDFKRSQKAESFQAALNKPNSLLSQRAFKSNESQSKMLESALAKFEQKPKFADQLKQLMNELEVPKPPRADLDQQQKQQLEAQQEDKIAKMQQLLAQQFTKTPQQSDTPNKTSNQNKLQELKKRMAQKQMAENAVQNLNEQLKSIDYVMTALGKMYRLDENNVLFEDSRKEKANQQNKLKQQAVFKVQSKKQKQQSQITQRQELKPIQDPKQQIQREHYLKHIETLRKALNPPILKQLRDTMAAFIKFQIETQKCDFLVALKNKMLLKQAFKRFQTNDSKKRTLSLIVKYTDKIQALSNKALHKSYLNWKMNIQLQKEHFLIKKKELKFTAFNSVSLILKHKNQQNLKFAFEKLKTYMSLLKKIQNEQTQKTGAQLIISFLLKKEQRFLNKKFQKLRKIMFLIAFDQKLMALTKLLNDKIQLNKRETFKQIINHCIRNEPYRKQIEQLSNEFQSQRLQMIEKQMKRMTKALSQSILKSGFTSIQMQSLEKKQKLKKLTRLSKILSKYQSESIKLEKQRAFRAFLKNKELQAKIKVSKEQACKKIKLLLTIKQNKQLKQKFEQWRKEAENFVNNEMTRINNEKSLYRNKVLEQLIVDLQWSNLSKSFQSIKRKARIHKSMQYLTTKLNKKKQKEAKIEFYNIWKNFNYRQKLIKVSLQVLLKGFDQREKKKLQTILKKWRSYVYNERIKDNMLYDMISLYEKKANQSCKEIMQDKFLQWKQSYFRWRVAQELLQKLIIKKTVNFESLYFNHWRQQCNQQAQFENKVESLQEIIAKLQLKKNLKRLKLNSENRTLKVKSMRIIDQTIKNIQEKSLFEAFKKIREYMLQQKQKVQNQQDSLKIIKRIVKLINLKVIQRSLLKWKITAIDKNVQIQKQIMQNQYKNKVLSTVFTKILQKPLSSGFQEMKQFSQKSQEMHLKNSLKIRSVTLFTEKLNNIYLQKMKTAFSQVYACYFQKTQNSKVQDAISKLSGVSKFYEILDSHRPDRISFYKWKNETLKAQAFEFGLGILEKVVQSKMRNHFNCINQQAQANHIRKTRQSIAMNQIKLYLYRQEKADLQKAFSSWQQNLRTLRPSKPPRASVVFSASQSVDRGSSAKKRSKKGLHQTRESLHQSFAPPPLLFKKASGKNNSANTSVVSQRNMRYSQQDEDEEEQDEMLQMDNTDFGDSTEKMIVIRAKLSDGGNKRESLWSNNSSENKRYASPMQDAYDDFKIAPLTTKNNPTESNLFHFLQDNNYRGITNKDPFNEYNAFGDTNKLITMTQDSSQSSRKSSSSKQKRSGKNKTKDQSRNNKSGLNKYLSGNSINQSQKSSSRGQSTTKKQDLQASNQKPSEVQISTPNIKFDTKILQTQNPVLEKPYQPEKTLFPQQINSNYQQQQSSTAKNQSKVLSPRSQLVELEPVPEEELDYTNANNTKAKNSNQNSGKNNHSRKRSNASGQQHKASVNSKLSSFLNVKVNQPKEDQKTQRLKSRENNEKFKVFLMKAKNNTQSKPSPSEMKSEFNQSQSSVNKKQRSENMNAYQVQQFIQGSKVIEKLILKKCLEAIILSAFSEEADIQYRQRLQQKQIEKLQRVVQIRKQMLTKEDFLKQEAFLLWKRSDFMQMLESLQMFKHTLSQLYKK